MDFHHKDLFWCLFCGTLAFDYGVLAPQLDELEYFICFMFVNTQRTVNLLAYFVVEII